MDTKGSFPIQLFCVVSTLGELTPIRFRYEDEEHRITTVQITQVYARKETQFAGTKAILYTCGAVIGDRNEMFELKYTINTHRWVFYRRLT